MLSTRLCGVSFSFLRHQHFSGYFSELDDTERAVVVYYIIAYISLRKGLILALIVESDYGVILVRIVNPN